MILCEKPLARNGKEAEGMVKAVEKAKVPNFVPSTIVASPQSRWPRS